MRKENDSPIIFIIVYPSLSIPVLISANEWIVLDLTYVDAHFKAIWTDMTIDTDFVSECPLATIIISLLPRGHV